MAHRTTCVMSLAAFATIVVSACDPAPATAPAVAPADSRSPINGPHRAAFDRVLLISIDGMHQSDLERFVNAHPRSALARLSHHGVEYANAFASRPSDSFPGLLAMLTGG